MTLLLWIYGVHHEEKRLPWQRYRIVILSGICLGLGSSEKLKQKKNNKGGRQGTD